MAKTNVLIVDDEEELVSALTERLELRGFKAKGVTSGAEALKALGVMDWDVVVVDIRMPGIDGFELARRVAAEHPSSAVVLLTGRTSAEDVRAAESVGAFEYLVKPVAIERLEEVLRAAADRQESDDE
jgi:DNA-binding NtrC family response regulator